ncbi:MULTISPECIES: GatB/YqeY domain-containing protein [Brochothrix]|mgnify:CR=1 FL=1|uniref:GatB/YqeY domain-containing protein n=1 Tax=Brochothrix thermosphacta TaxID=2756 RepID=A0A1D2LUX2_BROTH|nr:MULTISPECIES: GatB/YqeY domain-containing protein [Brochothrix]SLN05758.1 Transamidase GatB domain protein [Brachybacterium faecium]ANZ94502.1 hypothetical protein BFC19_03370 [Brochothrix thermosphacta]ANZ97187.1 hypothetical protein BFC20_05365 [Brochothrix thermosphacta]ATF26627.1 hypothetical protein CNY62_09645 [Brochothrix thermosphacta]ATH85982.1 hypothetical protein CPF12_09315 [Brochothrix thermosphacta]
MSLLGQLNQDMKDAMRAKDKARLSVIRMVKAAIQNESIKKGDELDSEEELTVLSREFKQRKESLGEFESAGREDLVAGLNVELKVIEEYLPTQLTEEEILAIVEEVIAETGATSKADFGKVMKVILPKVKGKADGSVISKLLQQKLS